MNELTSLSVRGEKHKQKRGFWGDLLSLSLAQKKIVCVQNPYVPGGETGGSSSGSAISVAANMAAVSLGTETDGSIICPAYYNSVVGLKPTVGLISRAGVIPVSPRQDSIGYEFHFAAVFLV